MKKIIICWLTIGSLAACTNSSSKKKQKQDSLPRDLNIQPDTSGRSDSGFYERMPGKTDSSRH